MAPPCETIDSRFLDTLFSELGFPDPAGSNRKAMLEAFRRTSEAVASYLSNVTKHPVPGSAVPKFEEALPQEPQGFNSLLEETFQKIVASSMNLSHPGYMAHMDSGVAFAGIIGDWIASSLNQNLLARELSPAASAVEGQVVRWFCELSGLPKGSGGSFVGGGTAANLTGLLAARDRHLPEVSERGLYGMAPVRIFSSEESHYSIRKAAALLGLGSQAVIPVAVDSAFRMSPDDLSQKIQAQRKLGARPLAIVATAGSTSTGSVDPIEAIAKIARQEKLWLHVDASHGGALLFSSRERAKLAGIGEADSIAFDPHKWLWAPKNAGVCLLRDFANFRPAQYQAPYLDREAPEKDLGRKTIDGSRHFDALKVWMILRHLGVKRLGSMIERNVDVSQAFYHRLLDHPHWMPLHKPQVNVLCFASRTKPGCEAAAYKKLLASGRGWISMSRVAGRETLRTVILNPSTGESELEEILAKLGS